MFKEGVVNVRIFDGQKWVLLDDFNRIVNQINTSAQSVDCSMERLEGLASRVDKLTTKIKNLNKEKEDA